MCSSAGARAHARAKRAELGVPQNSEERRPRPLANRQPSPPPQPQPHRLATRKSSGSTRALIDNGGGRSPAAHYAHALNEAAAALTSRRPSALKVLRSSRRSPTLMSTIGSEARGAKAAKLVRVLAGGGGEQRDL